VTQTVAVTGARSGITRKTAVQFAARVPKSHCCQRDRSGSCGVLTLPLLGTGGRRATLPKKCSICLITSMKVSAVTGFVT
jgi:NAD(P)-dependent dehydrogenase (short-subunit alcohol dehydrogenase family)